MTDDARAVSEAREQDVQRLCDRAITQAFVAGQMDAQYTASGHNPEVGPAMKALKQKAYVLAHETMRELVAAVRSDALRGTADLEAAFTAGWSATGYPHGWTFGPPTDQKHCDEAYAAWLTAQAPAQTPEVE